jgi:hypothetical protein
MIREKLGKQVLDDLTDQSEKENFSIDPLTLIIIVNLILTIIKFILENYISDDILINNIQRAKHKRSLTPYIRWSVYYKCLLECKRPVLAIKMQNTIIDNMLKLSDEEKALLIKESL